MRARVLFDDEKPPEDQGPLVRVRQQSIFIDGVRVTAKNDAGWLSIDVETTDAIKGWALRYNGRDFPDAADSGEAG